VFSCGTTKKVVKNKPANKPEEKKEEKVVHKNLPEKIDTIVWKEIPAKSDDKEIPEESSKEINKTDIIPLAQIHMMALIPFKAGDSDTSLNNISSANLRFVHYYAGIKMALDEFNRSEQIPIKLDVFDTGESDRSSEILNENQSALPQIVIGPYKSEALKLVADWAKKNKTIVISPWISSSTITEKNPYYFQVKAGLNAHYQLINEHVRSQFPLENILLISKSKEESKLKLFNNQQSGLKDLKEEIISEEDIAIRPEPILEKFLKEDGPTVFVLPLASLRDENYIYHFLRRVISEKKNKTVYVYGMYKWLDMKSEIQEYINSLNVRISMSNFVDSDRPEVKAFKRKYFEWYNEFPSEDAMEGYDLIKYLIRSMKKYGKSFYLNVDEPSEEYLETQFTFKPVKKNSQSPDSEIDYYENSYIKLVEIKENKIKVIE
jgi:ABC-type branched-subunit amino acid transport system substrate-binding protein